MDESTSPWRNAVTASNWWRKARLVIKGYRQKHGIDYHETFAAVSRMDSVRCISHDLRLGRPLAGPFPMFRVREATHILSGWRPTSPAGLLESLGEVYSAGTLNTGPTRQVDPATFQEAVSGLVGLG
jgi:hypothetical protein